MHSVGLGDLSRSLIHFKPRKLEAYSSRFSMAMAPVGLIFVYGFLTFTGATYPSSTEYCINSDYNCCLTGKWQNELGSTMEIMSCHNGSLSGKYNSSVGRAKASYDLAGRYTIAGSNNKDYIVGFSVAWNNIAMGNSQSTTSWTGIYYASEGIIHTHWILTRYMKPEDLWATNQIGHDDFKRI